MPTFSPRRSTRRYAQIVLSHQEISQVNDAWLLFTKVDRIIQAKGVAGGVGALAYRWHRESPCGITSTFEMVKRDTFEADSERENRGNG